MAVIRINRSYYSFLEYLMRKRFPFAEKFYQYFCPEDYAWSKLNGDYFYSRGRWDLDAFPEVPASVPWVRLWQVLGGLQPIVDVGKDFIDTFKPYKSIYHIKRDFMQPISGIGNIAKGIVNLIGAPIYFVFELVNWNIVSSTPLNLYTAAWFGVRALSWLLEGAFSLARGITQIAATPLTWFIKMPVRELVTLIKGAPKMEENKGIQRLVADGKRAIEEIKALESTVAVGEKNLDDRAKELKIGATKEQKMGPSDDGWQLLPVPPSHVIACKKMSNANNRLDFIRHELHRKSMKVRNRGQLVSFTSDQERRFFQAQCFFEEYDQCIPTVDGSRVAAASQYMGLFSADVGEQRMVLQSDPIQACKRQSPA